MSRKTSLPALVLPPEFRSQARFFEALRENINVITGRVNNKITLVNVKKLTAVGAPTKAEYDALAVYVSEVATAVNSLISRLDE